MNQNEITNLSEDYKPVPVIEARAIAERYDKDQVLIFAWDKRNGRTHITTYGSDEAHARMAAKGGNKVAEILGLKQSEREYENYLDDAEYQNSKLKKPR